MEPTMANNHRPNLLHIAAFFWSRFGHLMVFIGKY